MNKIMKKLIALLVSILLIAPMCFTSQVYAAETARISVGSKSDVKVGDDFSVSVSIDASNTIVAAQIWISYDPSVLELTTKNAGGSGTASLISYGESTMTLSFKAKSPGSSSLKIIDDVVAIGDEIKTTTTKTSGSVTVSAPVSYSTDNTLSSLQISPGVLSPAFSPNVTEYTTSVGADCSQLVVNAVANDGNASVSVSGKKLDPGRNTTTITVTAQNSSTRKYVIYTTKEGADDTPVVDAGTNDQTTPEETPTVEEVPKPTVKVDGAEYTVNNDFAAHPLPTGYEVSDFDYDGQTIQVGKGVNTKLILMYLESPDGNSGFYVYDSVSRVSTPYNELAQPQITYVVLPITDTMEKPEGYKLTTYKINDKEATVLMDDTKNFALFYGVSSTGVTGWFRYDCKDGTIQSYTDMGNAIQITDEVNKTDNNDMWKKIAVGTGAASIVLLITVIILAIKSAQNKKHLLEAIKGSTAEASVSLHEEDDLLADDYEDDQDEDDLGDLIDHDTEDNQDKEDDKSYARKERELYQKEVAATVAAEKDTAFTSDDDEDDDLILDIEEVDNKK